MPTIPTDQPLIVSARICIPAEELRFSFVRSSGPGGQNVNKVATKAVLRWSPVGSAALSEPVRQRFSEKYGHRLTAMGDLVLTSQRHRQQARNAADCLEKLRAMLLAVATAPRKRRATKPSKAAIKRRLDEKRQQSEKKRRRGAKPSEE